MAKRRAERTVFVDYTQSDERSNFTEAHETAHQLIPWHAESFILDHEATLFREVTDELEAEANHTSALIIFQNGRFHHRALDHERSIKTPILLAPDYRASLHVAIRHYVELHPDPVALLITGRYARLGGLPIWSAITPSAISSRALRCCMDFRGWDNSADFWKSYSRMPELSQQTDGPEQWRC